MYNKKPVANKRGPNKKKQGGKEGSAKKILEYLSDAADDFSDSTDKTSSDEQRAGERPEAEEQPCVRDEGILQNGT